jgi:hypothetical protein
MLQYVGYLFLGILLLARFSCAVPASPSDKLWEEIGNVKAMMAAVSGMTVSLSYSFVLQETEVVTSQNLMSSCM